MAARDPGARSTQKEGPVALDGLCKRGTTRSLNDRTQENFVKKQDKSPWDVAFRF